MQKIIFNNFNKVSINHKSLRIAFLGPKGSFSHLAALNYAEQSCNKILEIYCLKFKDIVKKVEYDKADYALLPIENSNSGLINDVYDILKNTQLSIIKELIMPIEHCILVSNKTNLQKIETIYSHYQAFRQCSKFVSYFSNWQIKLTASTAIAMQQVSMIKSPKLAALGSKIGGSIYNLQVIAHKITNQYRNYTKFVILAKKHLT